MRHLKQEFDRLTLRELITLLLSVSCMSAATVAVFLGMYLPPAGEIHSSVLTYFGISSGFCGATLGISTVYSSEVTKFKRQIMDMINKFQASASAPEEPKADNTDNNGKD